MLTLHAHLPSEAVHSMKSINHIMAHYLAEFNSLDYRHDKETESVCDNNSHSEDTNAMTDHMLPLGSGAHVPSVMYVITCTSSSWSWAREGFGHSSRPAHLLQEL